jgi:hypothetical protein
MPTHGPRLASAKTFTGQASVLFIDLVTVSKPGPSTYRLFVRNHLTM